MNEYCHELNFKPEDVPSAKIVRCLTRQKQTTLKGSSLKKHYAVNFPKRHCWGRHIVARRVWRGRRHKLLEEAFSDELMWVAADGLWKFRELFSCTTAIEVVTVTIKFWSIAIKCTIDAVLKLINMSFSDYYISIAVFIQS